MCLKESLKGAEGPGQEAVTGNCLALLDLNSGSSYQLVVLPEYSER